MRESCLKIKPEEFLRGEEYIDKHIWDLKYISTSDEEDNDSENTEDEEEEEDNEGKSDEDDQEE